MKCFAIGRDFGLGFLHIVTRAMGCFFGCFRVRDSRRTQPYLFSDPVRPRARDALFPRNRLASLYPFDENESLPLKGRKRDALVSLKSGVNVKQLRDEAMFLKACGTLLETPAEIRKFKKTERFHLHDGNSDPSKFHSWLPNTSIKKLPKQPEHFPTPVKLCEEWGMVSNSSGDPPSSCVSDGKNLRIAGSSCQGSGLKENFGAEAHATDNISIHSASSNSSAASLQDRNKFVRFECESGTPFVSSSSSSSEVVSNNVKKIRSSHNHSLLKASPNTTPVKLNDEMQTPGTVYPANLDNLLYGKHTRIRTQFVYSVLNPVESFSQWTAMKDGDSSSNQLSGQERDSLEQPETMTLNPEEERGSSEHNALKVEASLSAWLKPPSSSKGGKEQYAGAVSGKNHYFGRTPGDRPILGTVATHWKECDSSQVSPRWWDGNGIPNSTNKYREDQKVIWHATPFEERLEKALSEEHVVPQRRHSGTPLVFYDSEEFDTAMSQMKSSGLPKSVVSC